MFSSSYLLAVVFLGLYDSCMPAVVVRFHDEDVIFRIYQTARTNSKHRGHLATLTSDQYHALCNDRKVGNYVKNDDVSHPWPHAYKVGITPERQEVDVAIECVLVGADPSHRGFFLSYGFAKWMNFVSTYVQNNFLLLAGVMYQTPIVVEMNEYELEEKYFQLRERTEKAREESETFMNGVESNDDISSLNELGKMVLCALVIETKPYKDRGLKFVPVPDNVNFYYQKISIEYRNEDFKNKKHPTDCLMCRANRENGSTEDYFITRTYDNDFSTFVIREENQQYLVDRLIKSIAVLANRQYLGEEVGVIET